MLALPPPRHLPCERCGASVLRAAAAEHACDEERLHAYAVFQLRGELQGFDDELAAWLDSPAGRFAQYDAARRRPPP